MANHGAGDEPVAIEPMRTRILWLALNEVLEKLARLSVFVRQCEGQVPAGRSLSLPAAIQGQVSKVVSDALEIVSRRRAYLQEDDDTVATIFGNIQELTLEFQKLHQSLQWLSRPWVGEQTYSFLEDFAPRPGDGIRSTLAYMHVYNWTFNIGLQLPPSTSPVETSTIALPCAEQHNPLMWPIMLHEVGHDIAERHGLAAKVREELPAENKTSHAAWASEFVADLVAVRMGGPAYWCALLSLAVFFIRNNLRRRQQAHPPPLYRLELIERALAKAGIELDRGRNRKGFKTLRDLLSRRSVIDSKERDHERDDEKAQKIATSLGDRALECVYDETLPFLVFGTRELGNAELLADRLASGQMISSRPGESAGVEELRKGLAALRRGKGNPLAVLSRVGALDQQPARAVEIVTAGWLHRANSPLLIERLLGREGDPLQSVETTMAAYLESLEEQDRLLEKSLEVAAVHGVFSKPEEA